MGIACGRSHLTWRHRAFSVTIEAQMSDSQFLVAMAVPSALNTLAVIVAILINVAKLRALRDHVDGLIADVTQTGNEVSRRGSAT